MMGWTPNLKNAGEKKEEAGQLSVSQHSFGVHALPPGGCVALASPLTSWVTWRPALQKCGK